MVADDAANLGVGVVCVGLVVLALARGLGES
jgi:hypothetical protein